MDGDPSENRNESVSRNNVTPPPETDIHAVAKNGSTTDLTPPTETDIHAVAKNGSTTDLTPPPETDIHAVAKNGSTTDLTPLTKTDIGGQQRQASPTDLIISIRIGTDEQQRQASPTNVTISSGGKRDSGIWSTSGVQTECSGVQRSTSGVQLEYTRSTADSTEHVLSGVSLFPPWTISIRFSTDEHQRQGSFTDSTTSIKTATDDKQKTACPASWSRLGENSTDNAGNTKSIDPPSQHDANGETTTIEDTQGIKTDDKTPANSQVAPVPSSNVSPGSIRTGDPAIIPPPNNMVLTLPAILVLIVSIFILKNKVSSSEACNMKIAENRDFNKYYGIVNVKNHFITTSADECESNIIFKPAFPQTILEPDHSASSFVTLTPYGTGKTLLRCEYFKSLRSDAYFKVLILNKQIHEYLERFVKKATNGKNCDKENCLEGWSKNEFGQLLLSLLVTQFVETFEKEQLNLPDITLDEKLELIPIICYYYNEQGVNKLEKIVNALLMKTGNSMYSASKAEIQIKERHFYQDKPLLTHLKNDLKKLSALRQDDEKLHLLLAIAEGEGFQYKAIETVMSNNVFNDLTHFTMFMKNHVKKVPVFIIDGIDENRFFFEENKVHKKSLELFYRSSISEEILQAAISQKFYLSLFYPEIDGVDINDTIVHVDRFPVYTMPWNTKLLINYADYILQEMNNDASASRCKSFTDFKTLVNYGEKKNAEIINQISTPRALHYFMSKLITEMNDSVDDVHEPFIATAEDIHAAYQSLSESFVKRAGNVA